MALDVYYEAEHANAPVVVTTADQVRALIGDLADSYWVLLTVVVTEDPWKSELCVGINQGKGVLRYAGEDSPFNGLYSKSSTPSNAEPVLYYYITADSEFPPDSEIPLDAVANAMIEYLTSSGEKPTSVTWQTRALPS